MDNALWREQLDKSMYLFSIALVGLTSEPILFAVHYNAVHNNEEQPSPFQNSMPHAGISATAIQSHVN
jgi:hypothetical protein